MSFGVTVSVDVDGEAGLADAARESLTTRSERRYGIVRGLARVLGALEEVGACGTFYVPGVTAIRHPDAVAAILAGGHEVGHHGHEHFAPDSIDATSQRTELELGLAALADVAGEAPSGYRAPGWALTETTLELLGELGFGWDSSLMHADEPVVIEAGQAAIWELPVQWTLDDAAWLSHPSDPAGMLAVWRAEIAEARGEDRHVTLTLHPEVIGMAHRAAGLRRLLHELASEGTAFPAHGALVAEASSPEVA